jgi:hypothetical protein
MIEWLAVCERRIDVRRANRDGHGGYPVGTLYVRQVLVRITAETRAQARALAPQGTDTVVSVASLRVSDPDGWLRCRVGEPMIAEVLRIHSAQARTLVAQRRHELLAVA